LGAPMRDELKDLARLGNGNAVAALIAAGMKRTVLASRY
jgi:hypothetical protein